jgi:HK97 family phage major capsid protein
MKYKFFKMVDGKKFCAYEDGVLVKDAEGQPVEATDENLDEGAEEVANDADTGEAVKAILGKATKKALETGDEAIAKSLEKASGAVDSFFSAITEKAEKASASFTPAVKEASFDVEEVKTGLAEVASNKRQSMSFEIKNKSDFDYLAKSTSEGDLTGDVIELDRVPEVTRDPVRTVFIEQISDTTPVGSNGLSYVEVVTETGAPATTAELATMPEKDFAFQEFKAMLKKVTVTNKHSVELLKDAPQLVSAIKGWLATDLNIAVDDQLLAGDGTGANLTGVLNVATDLDTEIGSQTIASPNLFDIIRIGMTKMMVAGKGKFVPTHVILNPADAEELDLTKDADGRYIMPPFVSAEGTTIKGASVIVNVGITAGTFLLGDFRHLHVGRQGGVEVEITNADGTDFVKDIITVKLRRRIASYVRANDSGAFYTGDIETIRTNLTS